MIEHARSSYSLLAFSQEMHRVWGRFDHQKPGITPSQWLMVLGLLAAVVVGVIIWRIVAQRAKRTYSSNNPTKLFNELCKAHGIDRAGRRLLKRLADARGESSAAQLFLDPQAFELQTMPGELRPAAKELKLLRERLFD